MQNDLCEYTGLCDVMHMEVLVSVVFIKHSAMNSMLGKQAFNSQACMLEVQLASWVFTRMRAQALGTDVIQ